MRARYRARIGALIAAFATCLQPMRAITQPPPVIDRPVTARDVIDTTHYDIFTYPDDYPKPQWAMGHIIVTQQTPGYEGVILAINPNTGTSTRLTAGEDPVVAPNQHLVAFIRGDTKSDTWWSRGQLYLLNLDNRRTKQLTWDKRGMSTGLQRQIAWSPTSKHIALVTVPGAVNDKAQATGKVAPRKRSTVVVEGDDPDAHNFTESWSSWVVRIFDASSGASKVVYTRPVEAVSRLGWIPGKNALLFNITKLALRPTGVDYRTSIDELDLSNGIERVLLEQQLGGQGSSGPLANADGSRILFYADPWHRLLPTRSDLAVLSSNGEVTSLDAGAMVQGAVWGADGRTIYGVSGPAMQRRVFQIDSATGSRPIFVDEDAGVDVNPSPSSDGKWLAWVHIDLYSKATLRVEDLNSRQFRDLRTVSNPLAGLRLAKVQRVTWTAPDGLPLAGLLFTPRGASGVARYPMLVGIHGGEDNGLSLWGPILMYSVAEPHFWAAQGYVVFEPDYRTSGMYGPDVIDKLRTQRSRYITDASDVLSGVDAVCHDFVYINCARLVLSGQSWGGAYAAFLLTQDQRFKAAVIADGLGDSWENAPGGTQSLEAFYLGPPTLDNADVYNRNSSAINAAHISTPTIWMQAENGANSPALHYIFSVMHARGIPTVRLFYGKDFHVLLRQENRADFLQRSLRWFSKYARPDGHGIGNR